MQQTQCHVYQMGGMIDTYINRRYFTSLHVHSHDIWEPIVLMSSICIITSIHIKNFTQTSPLLQINEVSKLYTICTATVIILSLSKNSWWCTQIAAFLSLFKSLATSKSTTSRSMKVATRPVAPNITNQYSAGMGTRMLGKFKKIHLKIMHSFRVIGNSHTFSHIIMHGSGN